MFQDYFAFLKIGNDWRAGNAHWAIIPASRRTQFAERYRNTHWARSLVGLLATLTTLSKPASSDPNKPSLLSTWKEKILHPPKPAGRLNFR